VGEADQAVATEIQKKRKKKIPKGQQPGKTKTELLLKYQHQERILEE
jgi:hypothetical protein